MFKITPATKPRWFQFRKQLSRLLVWLARKVEPDCDYVNAHFAEQMSKAMQDHLIYGQGTLKIEHVPYRKARKGEG